MPTNLTLNRSDHNSKKSCQPLSEYDERGVKCNQRVMRNSLQREQSRFLRHVQKDDVGNKAFMRYLYPADKHVMNTWVIEMLSTLLFSCKLDINPCHWEALSTILQFVVQELGERSLACTQRGKLSTSER